jgi:protein-L-isoaspartate(D-aspartate) O-methyltransferase
MPEGDANPSVPEPQTSPPRREELERLIADTIEARGVRDPRVIDAMRRIARHCFVPSAVARAAYSDYPLPIGHGQTISQPYIVALMTEAGINGSLDRCLEIGTGCGYQTAILSLLCREVFSVEVVNDLLAQSHRNLAAAGCLSESIHLRLGDGYHGWQEYAPFDLIVVTAAPSRVPPPLLAQLAMGGRLVIPIGPEQGIQQLQRWTRMGQGNSVGAFCVESLLDVRFVPMVGTIRNT